MDLLDRLSLDDHEKVARLVLERPTYEWIRTGAGRRRLEKSNRRAFDRRRLRPRFMVDVSSVSLTTTILGAQLAVPIAIAPVAVQRAIHPDGEIGTAAAARDSGSLMVLAANSSTSMEDVARACEGRAWWLQVWTWKDASLLGTMVARAEAAGCAAIVVTVNTPVPVEHADPRIGFRPPAGVGLAHYPAPGEIDPRHTWAFVERLAGSTPLPVVVKGILRPDDADEACAAGARAIIVSNHGGRQLPSSLATLDALETVTSVVGGRAEVYLDGGVRQGSDILIALALGARAVMIGRPAMWGLALGGARGVQRVITGLAGGLRDDASLCGVTSVQSVPRDVVTELGD